MSDLDHVIVELDGDSLTLTDLVQISRDPNIKVKCSDASLARVAVGWEKIEQITRQYESDWCRNANPVLDYGITTGFGEFKNVAVAPSDLLALQRNIILSHCAGVGDNAQPEDRANYFPTEVVRAALVIRLNAFLKGHSGVRPGLTAILLAMLNRGVIPLVPLRGSVGSSGDLAPLSHLFSVLLGEGRYYLVNDPGELYCGIGRLQMELGVELPSPFPSYKEGLALTNGATFTAALLALSVHDAEALANASDVAAALSFEAVCGCARALDPQVHQARPHRGQIDSAANLRSLLRDSQLLDGAGGVQDVYSLRCAPQVHGASRDSLAYARMIAETEINAATDNPLFFESDERWDHQFCENWPKEYKGDQRISYSAGNFHGEPIGMAADFLAVGLAELANISERRIQMLLDAHHNRNLPGNLVSKRGVNSGYMIAQYCAAGLVSENKVLAHPASVDSIPTSANAEDHNAMATIAARKLRSVLHNAQAVLAIELLVAVQAIDWRVGMGISPCLKASGSGDERLQERGSASDQAEWEASEFERRTDPEHRLAIVAKLGRGTRLAYSRIRGLVPPLITDRTLDGEICIIRGVLENNSLITSLSRELQEPLRPIVPLMTRL